MTETVLTPRRPRKSRKKLFIFLGIVAVIVVAVAMAIARGRREKPVMVTTEKAFRKTITQLVTATGKIQPEVEVKISPEVSGEIIELPVKEGQIVHKGDLLLRIKPDTYRAQVEVQEAALSGARAASVQHRAEMAKAESDYKRAKELFDSNLIAETDLTVAQTNFDIAKASLEASLHEIERAEGSLRQMREALAKTTILSPADGSITSLTSRLGERVVGTSQFAGTEVMRIADLKDMEAQVNVNENDVVNVKVGDVAKISVDALGDKRVTGTVREIASTATTSNAGTQEEVTNFLVKISIPDASLGLRPGMSCTADVETATVDNAIAVPIQSVTVRRTDTDLSPEEMAKQEAREKAQDQSGNRADVTNEQMEKQKERARREKLERVVFVKDGDVAKMRKVETGIADATDMEIKSGIEPGDEVISGSYTAISTKLKDGTKIAIEKPEGN